MSNAIGPGDYIECIETWHAFDGPSVFKGRVYLCTEVGFGCVCPSCGQEAWVDVAEVPPSPDLAWCVCLFRPIYRPSESQFLERLMDVPVSKELESA